MVNNAGITRDATMRKMTEDQFDQVIAVHLKGTWNGTRLAADIMRENRRGAIVNISSISGQGRPDRPDQLLGGQGGHRRHDQGRGQGGRAPRRAHQRDPAGSDPLGDDGGHAADGSGTPSSPRCRWRAPANPSEVAIVAVFLGCGPVVLHDGHRARSDRRAVHVMGDVMRDTVICEPVRTPIGRYGGMFKSLTAVDLGVAALQGAARAHGRSDPTTSRTSSSATAIPAWRRLRSDASSHWTPACR